MPPPTGPAYPPAPAPRRGWWANMGTVGQTVLALVIVAVIGSVWWSGTLDSTLSGIGLNAHPCGTNAFGATFCGDDLKHYCHRFKQHTSACRAVEP